MYNKFLDNGTRLAFRQNSQDHFVLSRIKSAFIFSARSWQFAQGHFSILKCKCKSILLAFQRKHIFLFGSAQSPAGVLLVIREESEVETLHSLEMTKERTLLGPVERKGHLLTSQPRGRSWWTSIPVRWKSPCGSSQHKACFSACAISLSSTVLSTLWLTSIARSGWRQQFFIPVLISKSRLEGYCLLEDYTTLESLRD